MLFSRYGADMGIVIISPIYGSFARSETSILALVGAASPLRIARAFAVCPGESLLSRRVARWTTIC
jgi:hypothetical protein